MPIKKILTVNSVIYNVMPSYFSYHFTLRFASSRHSHFLQYISVVTDSIILALPHGTSSLGVTLFQIRSKSSLSNFATSRSCTLTKITNAAHLTLSSDQVLTWLQYPIVGPAKPGIIGIHCNCDVHFLEWCYFTQPCCAMS